jgi:hypothetical protein
MKPNTDRIGPTAQHNERDIGTRLDLCTFSSPLGDTGDLGYDIRI